MVWHWLVSLLALGTTVVLFDGSPFHPQPDALWKLIQEEKISYFGTSARYLAATEKAGVKPRVTHNLQALRLITSTGSPLSIASSHFVYRDIKEDLHLASITGGTEINGCLAIASPVQPMYPAEIQCAPLGMDSDVVDTQGRPIIGVRGELVCRNPFPSQPLLFWGDETGEQYNNAYFVRFPGIWCHGDFAERTKRGGFIIHGRSDATLNPGGVRLGTYDYYTVLDAIPSIADRFVFVFVFFFVCF
jgi:acetoacetyl-CoA synthetase